MYEDINRLIALLMSIMIIILQSNCCFINNLPNHSKHDFALEYDYIIIGGGSAGAVVANRLSEDPSVLILLVEAGDDENIITEIPAAAAILQLSDLDWKYKTTTQPEACWGMQCHWPRGKVLGGSSTINFMLYVRGNRNDYDAWANLGNTGWTYQDVLPYFLKSEDFTSVNSLGFYHNKGGYLSVSNSSWQTPLARAFIESGIANGYQETDVNGATQTGFTVPPGTIRNGARCSTAKAFIRSARNRTNLHVLLRSHVTKILFDNGKRAIGIIFYKGGKQYITKVRREVILSAGAINSPQLLMLSGIGPGEHLHQHGISVISDLPGVGKNLQDHIGVGIIFTVNKPVSVVHANILNIFRITQWCLFGSGPLSVLGGVEGLAFVNSCFANKSIDWPDIEYHFVSGSVASAGRHFAQQGMGFSDEFWNGYLKPISGKDCFTVTPTLLRPRSKGIILLNSTDPFDPPIINPNYLTDQQDVNILIDGIKMAIALGKSEPFKKFGAKFHDKLYPTCVHEKPFSDEYWGCVAKTFTTTIYHPVGTCKMGQSLDFSAVVDSKLRVYGVKNLRVIDASIMPVIVSGNTNAPSIMIGEKGADFVKQYWSNR